MIDYKIDKLDLVKKGIDLELVKSLEAKKQSMLIRLTIERGSFIYDENLGSRLKNLYREKPSKRNEMAELYVRETLEPETDITIEKVDLVEIDKKKILILVYFIWDNQRERLEVRV